MNNFMSFSTYVDAQGSDKGKYQRIQSRSLRSWVPDEKISQCFQCHETFGLFLRKHHCRVCGRIFCWKCSQNLVQISPRLGMAMKPYKEWGGNIVSYFRELTGRPTELEIQQKYRVCDVCHQKNINLADMDVYIKICQHLAIPDLLNTAKVSTIWRQASIYVLSEIREYQYYPSYHPYTTHERENIWNHRKWFSGHGKWILQLIRITDWTDPQQRVEVSKILRAPRSRNCWSMMCSRDCTSQVGHLDALELFRYPHRIVINYAIHCMNSLTPQRLVLYIPLIVRSVAQDLNKPILDFLIRMSISDEFFLAKTYWELISQAKLQCIEYFVSQIKERVSESSFRRFHCVRHLIWSLKSTSGELSEETILETVQQKNIDSDLYYPFYPYNQCREIMKIRVKNSYKKPMEVVMHHLGKEPDRETCRFLFKKDDLRKDQLVMTMIRICHEILKRDLKEDYGIISYEVLPVDDTCGVVEMIDQADTIYQIRDMEHTSILNYILDKNPDQQITELRNRFIRSTSAYCVISYLLGIGDRHLDNIMVTHQGHLFHIDFEYLLGHNPKPLCHEIRITSEIIDAIGGTQSAYYREFQSHCCTIYNCLRRYYNMFYEFLRLMPGYSSQEIEKSIELRFSPGEHSVEAEEQLTKIIEDSYDSFGDSFMDLFHHYSRQSSLKDSVGQWLSSIQKMTRHVFNL